MWSKLRCTMFLFLLIMICFMPVKSLAEPSISTDKELSDALLTSISPNIYDAIAGYYGKTKQFSLFNAKILSLKRQIPGGFSFLMKVQVITFVGAHNPPYGLETITLDVSVSRVSVVKFDHKEIEKP